MTNVAAFNGVPQLVTNFAQVMQGMMGAPGHVRLEDITDSWTKWTGDHPSVNHSHFVNPASDAMGVDETPRECAERLRKTLSARGAVLPPGIASLFNGDRLRTDTVESRTARVVHTFFKSACEAFSEQGNAARAFDGGREFSKNSGGWNITLETIVTLSDLRAARDDLARLEILLQVRDRIKPSARDNGETQEVAYRKYKNDRAKNLSTLQALHYAMKEYPQFHDNEELRGSLDLKEYLERSLGDEELTDLMRDFRSNKWQRASREAVALELISRYVPHRMAIRQEDPEECGGGLDSRCFEQVLRSFVNLVLHNQEMENQVGKSEARRGLDEERICMFEDDPFANALANMVDAFVEQSDEITPLMLAALMQAVINSDPQGGSSDDRHVNAIALRLHDSVLSRRDADVWDRYLQSIDQFQGKSIVIDTVWAYGRDWEQKVSFDPNLVAKVRERFQRVARNPV